MQRPMTASGQAPGQFNLKWLLILLTVCAMTIRSTRLLGWESTAWIGAAALVVVLICFAFAVAPVATKYALTLGAVAMLFLSLLACGIYQSRQQARQLQWSDNLRRVGIGFLERQDLASRTDEPLGSVHQAYIPDRRIYPPAPTP
jgi:predicted lysophospholipase L1 biosynthesis ABC-type transport system permease subunit